MSKTNKKPMGAKVTRVVILLTMLSTLSIGGLCYYMYRKNSMVDYANTARDVSLTIAAAINPSKFIESSGSDTEDEYWQEIKNYLDTVKTSTEFEYMYILTLHDDASGIFKYYAEGMKPSDDPDDIFEFGYIETNPEVFAYDALETIRTGQVTTTTPYDSDGFGFMVSGFAPILDADNKPIGVVGTDISVDTVLRQINMFGLYAICAGVAFSLVFALLSKQYIQRLIAYVLKRITDDTLQLAEKGTFSFVTREENANDVIGVLYANFAKVVSNFSMLINDMQNMYTKHEEGEFETLIDESKYVGGYLDIVKGVNSMTSMYVTNFKELLEVMQNYGNGYFEANVGKYPGKLSIGNTIVDELRNNLIHVNEKISELTKTALDGNLSARASAEGLQGDWQKIIDNLNNLIETIIGPFLEASDVLRELSHGNLNVTMKGDYKGDFSLIKDNLNNTIGELTSYIKEIEKMLDSISKNDLSVKMDRSFSGSFVVIEKSIQSIIEAQNMFFGETRNVAEQLNSSAAQISLSGSRLSDGVSDQLEIIRNLTDHISTVNAHTLNTATNATEADKISIASLQNAARGNEEMKKMLDSMDAINNASANIAKIIKVIDDIAFQTNMLALNASVEAARAGEHGKGFAVVAEEVRNLAARSLSAAKQTQELIDDTIARVNEGVTTAHSTSDAFVKIVDNVQSVSGFISKISSSSHEQAISVEQMKKSIDQISTVVNKSSATADENVTASVELKTQSESLSMQLSNVKFR